MNFWECFWAVLPYAIGVPMLVCVGYPIIRIAAHKICGGKLTVREILKRI